MTILNKTYRLIEFLTILNHGYEVELNNVPYVILKDDTIGRHCKVQVNDQLLQDQYFTCDYSYNNFLSIANSNPKYLTNANVFELTNIIRFSVVGVLTNGDVNCNGEAIMSARIAKIVKQKVPGIEVRLGAFLKKYGNRVFNLGTFNGITYISFPTKHHWKENSDLTLIAKSCDEIKQVLQKFHFDTCFLPFPGIGNGHLSISTVKPVLDLSLDERFYICSL